MSLEFVNVSQTAMIRAKGTTQAIDKNDRRRIRTHAMMDFRRKERQKNNARKS
jgi:hypothetical protein